MHELAENIAESLTLDGTLEAVSVSHTRGLYAEPEWATPRYVHRATLLRSFVQGILTADPYHKGYRLPTHFEGVVNFISFEIQRRWTDVVPQVSLADFERFLRKTCPLHPEFLKWNETDKLVGVVSRYSPEPTERDFIDLDALYRNAAVALRDQLREDDAFDAEFERKHGKLSAGLASGETP